MSKPIDSNEQKVLAAHPVALEQGARGAVWIADEYGTLLSDICKHGTYNDRRADAWESAAQRC